MSNKNKKVITGLHILGQIQTGSLIKAGSKKAFKLFLSSLIKKHKLRELGSYYHKFGKTEGFTGVVCLMESHISVHTWPELQYITLDVFLCNYSQNNEETCRKLFSEICE